VAALASFATAGGAHAAAPATVFAPCGPAVPAGFLCGSVTVPLDRARPDGATIPIAFQLFPHTGSAAASEAVVVSIGGPGVSNLGLDALWLGRFQPALDRRDLLLIDHRGIGASGAIDCAHLQHVTGDQVTAARECGAQLGAAASRYGSGDVADDVEAVRQALGIQQLDYYGDSYGAVDVRAYAYRYASRLRTAVLDSPYTSMDETFLRKFPGAAARIQALVCRRSPSCSASNRDPEGTLEWLIGQVSTQPVTGTGYDADGNPHTLQVDEVALLGILYNDYFADPSFLNQGELTAAATALRDGDAAPLLRLAAESPAPSDYGDPAAGTSVGDTYAVFCSDARPAWDKTAPEPARLAQYRSALAALPDGATDPFAPAAWTTYVTSQPVLILPAAAACVPWPAPVRPNAPFPQDQPFPADVPALLLGGGLDYLDLNSERQLIPLVPSGTFVDVANAGHITGAWNPCANGIIVHFMETRSPGDTSCAADTKGAMHQPFGSATGTLQLQGVGRFPLEVADAVPASVDPAGADDTTLSDRRIASTAWAAVEDAFYRVPRMTGGRGRGLRGGAYTVARGAGTIGIDFAGASFSADVPVTGHAALDQATNTLDATVQVTTAKGAIATLTMHAVLWDPAHPTAALRGTIRGRAASLLVLTY
jgi:pimeloyl-ACP methyl ester carboxylesterase